MLSEYVYAPAVTSFGASLAFMSLYNPINFLEFYKLVPTKAASIVSAFRAIENPQQMLEHIYTLMKELTRDIRQRLQNPKEECKSCAL